MPNLKHFSMLGCHMTSFQIQPNAFEHNSKLTSVNITKCSPLRKLESEVFKSLPFLKMLNFHGCGLQSIDEESADWENLQHFDLSHNPLDCYCDLEWLQNILKNRRNLPPVKCKEPKNLEHKDLTRISENLCSLDDTGLPTYAIVLIIFAAIIVLVLALWIAYYYWKRRQKYHKREALRRPKSMPTKNEIRVITGVPEDMSRYVDVEPENIYEDLADMPLGSAHNYPDVKTTVL